MVAQLRTCGALLAVGLTSCEATVDVLHGGVPGETSTGSGSDATSSGGAPSMASTTPSLGGTDGGGTVTGSSTGSTGGSATDCVPEVRVTEVELGLELIGPGTQRDTEPLPLALAPRPAGGSLLAALGTDGQVRVVQLDELDQPVGFASSFVANDLVDLLATDEGGVLAVTRDARGGGTLHCGDPAALCQPPAEPVPCHDMVLVRFDRGGTETWVAPVTHTSEAEPPYGLGSLNHFVWRYRHHGRLATDGTNFALYFVHAIAATAETCVNIYEGDRMQVVDPAGASIDHPDAFALGCSLSWTPRMVWDAHIEQFVMACATDNEGRIARPDPYRTIVPASDLATLHLGDLVLAPGGGYWASVSDQGTTRLLHFVETTPDIDLPVVEADASHLVALGSDLLLAWASGTGISARVHDARTGAPKSAVFSIDVPDHRYQAFKAALDGSAAFPAQGSTSTSVRLARVFPCAGAE